MSAFKRFLSNHKAGHVTNLVSLSGGKWLIPESKYPYFLQLYFDAVTQSEDIFCFAEKKTNKDELFRMCADIDISSAVMTECYGSEIPSNLMNTIIDTFSSVLLECMIITPDLAKPVISCRLTEPSKCHLNWPGIIINGAIGSTVRALTVERLSQNAKVTLHKKDNSICHNWMKWIDNNCYGTSGLRLLGSLKKDEKCKSARYYVISGYDALNKPVEPALILTLEDIQKTSMIIPENGRTMVELTETGKKEIAKDRRPKLPITRKNIALKSENVETMSYQKLQCVQEGFKRSWTIENYPPELLEKFSIGEVKQCGDSYCMNNKDIIMCPFKNDYHTRNNPCHYHYMTQNGTTLRCHDEDCRKCRYHQNYIPLPPDLQQSIYIGSMVVNNNINNGTINNYQEDLSKLIQLDFVSDLKAISLYNNEPKDITLFKALNGSDIDLAYLLYQLANKKWIHNKSTGWWHWNGVKWNIDNDDLLTKMLHSSIDPLLIEVKELYLQLGISNKRVEEIAKKINQIDKLRKKVSEGDFVGKIMKQATWVFHSEDKIDITSILDTNPLLIGFNNGVYDLYKMEFRHGHPHDFTSMSTGYDYNSNSNINHKQEVLIFLESIMPDKDDRHYMLKFLSSALLGQNPDELFHIFTGAGRNGKSKLIELMGVTLGDYFTTCTSSFLTSKMNSSEQACPQLMSLKKSRMIVSSEPDHQGKLNPTIIKQLSGNDKISGRKLYGEQQVFKPNFKMILLCNEIPVINGPDPATWMRCRCLNFPTRFVENISEPHDRKIDKNISNKIPLWKLEFFHILLEYYVKWNNEGLNMTPNMTERTEEYQGESDIILTWLKTRTEPSDTNMHTCDLYVDYVTWFESLNAGKRPINHLEFVKGLKQHRTVKRGVWANKVGKQGVNNIKLKDNNDSSKDTTDSNKVV